LKNADFRFGQFWAELGRKGQKKAELGDLGRIEG